MGHTSGMLDRPALFGVTASATGRHWTGPAPEVERLGLAIAQVTDLPEIVGRILAARGVPPEEAAAYLEPRLRDLMPDPSALADMDAAAARLADAAGRGEAVAIFGDYDVDGAASAALLHQWLGALGVAATVYIPDRIDEGYGPNVPAMEALAAGHDLILCVDCGTLSHEPVAAAMAAGADVLVIDHHLPGETLPLARAVVNPNRADDASGQGHLCAAGVVFLLLVAANRVLREQGRAGLPDLMAMLDLVAVATVADVAPLVGLNRAFVRQGLAVLARRERPGLAALADVAGLRAPPSSRDLGFALGPRINAGGRVGRAGLGAELLTAPDRAHADRLAAELDLLNTERRRIEAEVLDAAVMQVEARDPSAPLVWAAGAGWHPGVVGIVAGRLKERFNRPAVVIGLDGEAGKGGEGKGSGRSVEGVDLGSAIGALAREGLLLKGGGHVMAAGLTVEADRVEPAMAALAERLGRQGAGTSEGPRALRIDGALAPGAATPELVDLIEAAGPFGQANPAPRFAFGDVIPVSARIVGNGHCQLRVRGPGGGPVMGAIAFGAAESGLAELFQSRAANRAPLHLAGRLEIDDWGGTRKAKLRIDDAAPAG